MDLCERFDAAQWKWAGDRQAKKPVPPVRGGTVLETYFSGLAGAGAAGAVALEAALLLLALWDLWRIATFECEWRRAWCLVLVAAFALDAIGAAFWDEAGGVVEGAEEGSDPCARAAVENAAAKTTAATALVNFFIEAAPYVGGG
jgi:hypothetical protein